MTRGDLQSAPMSRPERALRPWLPATLLGLAAVGLLVHGLRTAAAGPVLAENEARARLAARIGEGAAVVASRLAELEAGLGDRGRRMVVAADGTFLSPKQPEALAVLTLSESADPQGHFYLREGAAAEAASGDASANGIERAQILYRAAAASERDPRCRALARWHLLAIDRRAGRAPAGSRLAEFVAELGGAERRTFEGLQGRLELGRPDADLRSDILACVGGPDDGIATELLRRLGDDPPTLANRRAEVATIARLAPRVARGFAPDAGAEIDGDRLRAWRRLETGDVGLLEGEIGDLPSGTRIADETSLLDAATDAWIRESRAISARLPGVRIVADADRSAVVSEGRRNVLVVFGALVLLLLGGGAAVVLTWSAARATDAAARARSAFVSKVGHDLRTPLTVIRMYAETIARGRTRTAAETTEFATTIEQEAVRLSGLVDSVLDLGRLDSGEVAARRQPIDVRTLLDDVLASSRPLLMEHGIAVNANAMTHAATVRGNPDALRGVFMNLVENVINHAATGRTLDVSVVAEAPLVTVTVGDRGPGLPAALGDAIFQRFVRGPGVRTRGAGLGLALVREVVVAHGGEVRAEARPGGGAQVVVTLPLGPEDRGGAT